MWSLLYEVCPSGCHHHSALTEFEHFPCNSFMHKTSLSLRKGASQIYSILLLSVGLKLLSSHKKKCFVSGIFIVGYFVEWKFTLQLNK